MAARPKKMSSSKDGVFAKINGRTTGNTGDKGKGRFRAKVHRVFPPDLPRVPRAPGGLTPVRTPERESLMKRLLRKTILILTPLFGLVGDAMAQSSYSVASPDKRI